MSQSLETSRQWTLVFNVGLYSILWYDYALTLPREYRKIWRGEFTMAKLLYLLARYPMLIASILVLQGFRLNWETDRCIKYLLPWQVALPMLSMTANSMLVLLRCHAIWDRNRKILITLSVLYAIQLGVNIYLLVSTSNSLNFGTGPCIPMNMAYSMMSWCLLAGTFDIFAGLLALYHCFRLKRTIGQSVRSDLLENLIMNGTLYVLGASAAAFGNFLLMCITVIATHAPLIQSVASYLCTVSASILSARLVLSVKSDSTPNSGHGTSGSRSWKTWSTTGYSSSRRTDKEFARQELHDTISLPPLGAYSSIDAEKDSEKDIVASKPATNLDV